MKLHIFGLTLVLLTIFALPNSSHAYSVTNQTATDLGNGKALFTITYKFGFLNREMYMPIVTARGADADNYTVAYRLTADGKVANNIGTMAGLVFSNAEIKNNSYYLPKGKSAEFTLVTVVNTKSTDSKTNLGVAITSLPFVMNDDKIRMVAEVAKNELPAFKSPAITLK